MYTSVPRINLSLVELLSHSMCVCVCMCLLVLSVLKEDIMVDIRRVNSTFSRFMPLEAAIKMLYNL